MTHPDSPQVPPARDRGWAEGVPAGPLSGRLYRGYKASLSHMSELGVRLSAARISPSHITLPLDPTHGTVTLRAGVRSSP